MNENDWLARKGLHYDDGRLRVGKKDAVELCEEYGTPLYVTNQEIIETQYKALEGALKKQYDRVHIHYAVKANSNPSVLKILDKLGSYFDCVSTGEVRLCLEAGAPASKVLYTGNNFTLEELRFAIESGVQLNLDAVSQIRKVKDLIDPGKDLPLISFRINPETGAGHHDHCITAGKEIKFGILDGNVVEAYKLAKDAGFTRFGIQEHIGSGILDIEPFVKASKRFLEIAAKVANEAGITFEFIDFGGGIGIPYRPTEDPVDLDEYAERMVGQFKSECQASGLGEPAFCIEPGRYIACESTALLVQVNTIKETGYKNFAGIDAGFNTLVRPTMYGSYHHVIPCVQSKSKETKTYDVVGQICESGDVLARQREFNGLQEGDYLAFLDAGAYGFTMASEYNSRPLPAELLVNGTDAALMRERQSHKDLLRHVKAPSWLK